MMTFFTILLILICVNAAMMLVSLYSVNKKASTTTKNISDSTISKIYPFDLVTSKYNKAVQFFTFKTIISKSYHSKKRYGILIYPFRLLSYILILFNVHKAIFTCFYRGRLRQLTQIYNFQNFQYLFSTLLLRNFLVNIIGCLIIGLVLGISYKSNLLSQNQTLLLTTGFCGGFTTFSTFALENQNLLKSGEILHFSFYTIASIAVGIFAVILGLWLSKLM